MSPRFGIGDIVWYQNPSDENSFAKARVLQIGTLRPRGPNPVFVYSIQRLDVAGLHIHRVRQRYLKSVINRTPAAEVPNV